MAVKLEQIGHCAVRVRDVERAKRFYIDVLGFQFMEQDPDHGGVLMVKTHGCRATPIGFQEYASCACRES